MRSVVESFRLRFIGAGTVLASEAWEPDAHHALRRRSERLGTLRAHRVQAAPSPRLSSSARPLETTLGEVSTGLENRFAAQRRCAVLQPCAPFVFFDGSEGIELVVSIELGGCSRARQRHILRAVDGTLHHLIATVSLADELGDLEARRALSTYEPAQG